MYLKNGFTVSVLVLVSYFQKPFPCPLFVWGLFEDPGVSSSFGPCWLSGPHVSASRKAPFRGDVFEC